MTKTDVKEGMTQTTAQVGNRNAQEIKNWNPSEEEIMEAIKNYAEKNAYALYEGIWVDISEYDDLAHDIDYIKRGGADCWEYDNEEYMFEDFKSRMNESDFDELCSRDYSCELREAYEELMETGEDFGGGYWKDFTDLCTEKYDDMAAEIVGKIKEVWKNYNMANYWVGDKNYTMLCLETIPHLMELKGLITDYYADIEEIDGCTCTYEDGFQLGVLKELQDLGIDYDCDFCSNIDNWICSIKDHAEDYMKKNGLLNDGEYLTWSGYSDELEIWGSREEFCKYNSPICKYCERDI